MSGDSHPYDGVTRRFRHTDADTAAGVAAVGKLLRWAGPLAGLEYDVSFYSGRVGVLDRLAITFSVGEFVNEQRKEFQPVCLASDRVLFQRWSNVNDWLVLWGDDSRLSYLAYSAG